MKINSAEFVKGVVEGDEFWDANKPQFVFYGRSNTGKSSSINAILGRNALARPSGTPGKTREVNFFDINESFYFVDLPGYGYARISKVEQEKLRNLILWFIGETNAAKRIHTIVLDAKVGLTELDKEMLNILKEEDQEHI
ncbi:MAG: GTP-binding protein, partial [Candidatus Paceibacteria bacterium]